MTRPSLMVVIAAAYGAGLVTGLSHFREPALVVGAAVVIIVLVRDEWWWPAVPAFAVAAGIGAHAVVGAGQSCVARLPLGDHQYQLRTVDPGQGTGRVIVLGHQCNGMVTGRWPAGSQLPAGTVVRAQGRWKPLERWLGRPDGTLLIGAVDVVGMTPTGIERLRSGVARADRDLFGPRAPLANALVGGWRGELDPELQRAFAAAGLMHLLAISGFHLACVGGWLLLLLKLARVPRHVAELSASLLVLGYVGALGWPAAGTRAASLLLLAACCRWRQRNVRTDALLATSALIMLVADPWAVADVGAGMSVLGVAGVVAAIRWSDRQIGTSWWVRSVSGATGAVIATAPLAAGVFGQVAPIAVLCGVIGAPLLSLILPGLFGALALRSWMPAMARALAASVNGLLALLQALVVAGSHAPGSADPGRTGWPAALAWLLVLAASAWVIHRRSTRAEALRRLSWCATVGLWLALLRPADRLGAATRHQLALLFLDVGQGDAALIRTPLGHWIEIDAGPVSEGHDAGRNVVAPILARAGAQRVDLFVLSHAHRDHVGGGASVLARIPVSMAIEPGEDFADSAYAGWLGALGAGHVRWRGVRRGDHWTIDSVAFTVLHPPDPWPRSGEDLNEDSVVLEVRYGAFRALLMGDAGFVAESALAGTIGSVNLLKVGHHGSRTASSQPFLDAIHPQVAVVSVGRNNYGHPAPETLARLVASHASVWRTDQQGTVTVTTDGTTITVKGSRGTATFGTTH